MTATTSTVNGVTLDNTRGASVFLRGDGAYAAATAGNASYAAKGSVQGLTDAATSGLTISAGVISVNSGTSANNIVKLDASAKLPAVDGSQLTGVVTNAVVTPTNSSISSGTATIFTYTLPVLTANDLVEVEVPFSYNGTNTGGRGGNGSFTLTSKLSSTTVGTATVTIFNAPGPTYDAYISSGVLKFFFKNNASVSSQLNSGYITNPAGGTSSGNGYVTTAAEYVDAGNTSVNTGSAVAVSLDATVSSSPGTLTFKKVLVKIVK